MKLRDDAWMKKQVQEVKNKRIEEAKNDAMDFLDKSGFCSDAVEDYIDAASKVASFLINNDEPRMLLALDYVTKMVERRGYGLHIGMIDSILSEAKKMNKWMRSTTLTEGTE